MTKRKRKKKLRIGRIIIAIVILGVLVGLTYIGIKIFKLATEKVIYNDYYLSSPVNTIELFTYDKETEKLLISNDVIYRGTKVKSSKKTKTIDEINYIEIVLGDKNYYVKENTIVSKEKETVKEKEMFVRTSVTVYRNERDSKISSFIKKGSKIEIQDYDFLDEKGNVNMYKVKKDDIEGWVYRKYLVDSEESAKANYNENDTYDKHKDRKYYFELYGGQASTLDYYPYEKPSFEKNPLLPTAKSMYLNGGSNVINNVDSYLNIATSSGVNAIVVDIKDGALAYPAEIAKEYSQTAYSTAINSFENYKATIDKIKEKGIYVIGRIVVFNDVHYGRDHPEECISSSYANWPSAYSRGAWEYNVELAKESVERLGFNEIQFDYVRFPEASYEMSKSGNTNFKNKYNEEKAEAIQNFLFYATDQIHKTGAYLSVDVFGECSSEYVTSYGQYWPAISNIVDAISSMPYTDHFGRNNNTWTNAYQTVNNWAKGAAARQTEIPTPAVPRTWITAYDTPYWSPTITYDATKISEQAQALVDAGLKGGFITWNSASSIYKYNQIKSAFSKTYS